MNRASRAMILVVCLLAGLVATASPALAAAIAVDADADDGVGDSSCSLREAVEAANTNVAVDSCTAGTVGLDTITIAPGDVRLDSGIGTVFISEDLVIQSGGLVEVDMDGVDGHGFSVVPSVAATFQGLTLLDKDDDSSAIHNEGDLTLDTVVMANNVTDDEGGAVLNESGTLTVRDSSFEGNTADEGGGALYLDGGTATIEDSSFTDNSTLEDGGAISMGDTDLTIRRTEFVSNHADAAAGALFADCTCGGGGASLLVEDSTFSLNSAPQGGAVMVIGEASITGTQFSQNTADNGGAIWAFGGDPGDVLSVEESLFEGNEAAQDGGAIGFAFAEVHVTDSTLDLNASSNIGGAISSFESLLVIEGSTLSNNVTNVVGGAVYAGLSQVAVVNSTISGNSVTNVLAGEGGGLLLEDTSGLLLHATVTGNSTNTGNSAVAMSDPGDTVVEGSIIADNVGSTDCSGAPQDDATNLDSDASCFPGSGVGSIINADPLLGPLADNGGPTETHALLAGSPAINAGDASDCAGLNVDQRGLPRPSGGACDLGAYELQVAAPPSPTHTLTVTSDGAGTVTSEELDIDCGTECEATLDEGTAGVLVATPDVGSAFVGWEGDCESIDENECTIEMNGDREVIATFVGVVPSGPCAGMAFGSSEVNGGTEWIAGTPGDDVLSGNGRRNVICGLGGNDTIKGKNLNDDLLGGGGNDALVGGKGADLLKGGPGTDSCLGGKGKDRFESCE